jgi:hypothetical protein
MRRLAEECARCGQLEWLVALPLSPPEEEAVLAWLQTQVLPCAPPHPPSLETLDSSWSEIITVLFSELI